MNLDSSTLLHAIIDKNSQNRYARFDVITPTFHMLDLVRDQFASKPNLFH